MKLRRCLALLTLAAAPALAQSFNIELGTSGTAPSNSFGGAANQPGFWNSITSSSSATITLANLDGTASTCTMTRTTAGSFVTNTNANLTGDYAKLLNDTQSNTSLTYTFSNMGSGFFLVYTYALDTDAAASTFKVTVTGNNGRNDQTSGGSTPTSNFYFAGKTHTINTVFTTIGTFTVTVTPTAGGSAQCAGIQVVAIDPSDVHFHVRGSATGNGSGLTWQDAITNLQDAFDLIDRVGPNYSVWVAAGTYKPTTGSDQTASFKLADNTKYYGGFAGTETSLDQRTFPTHTYQTILSGAIGSSNVDSDNSQTVVDASDTSNYMTFDGFTIARGYNDSASPFGGGMRLVSSTATIRNCRFLYNFAASGGAVYVNKGYPNFVNCYFFQNSASGAGGAMSVIDPLSTIDVVNCEFFGNQSNGNGAAIYASTARLAVVNSLFTGNATGALAYGGAVYSSGDNSTVYDSSFTNCTFANNAGPKGGGAIYLTDKTAANIYNSILWNDSASAAPADSEAAFKLGTSCSFLYGDTTVKGFIGTNGSDPLFVNALGNDNTPGTTDDNLRLKPGSPCIDSANKSKLPTDVFDLDDDSYLQEPVPFDLDKKPRRSDILGVPDGLNAGNPALDRGCYELQMPACPADLDHDGQSDLTDFFAFFNAWDISAPAADLDLSGEVDLADFFLFFQYFDSGC